MTSLFRNLAVLFLLSAPTFLPSHLFTYASSTSRPVTRQRIIFMTDLGSEDDYDDNDEYSDDHSPPPDVVSSKRTTFLNSKPRLCQYDPCLEDQEPCRQISLRSGCLCPGVTGADVPPHAPRVQLLSPITEGENRGKVEVQWCAPSSVVSKYRVVIEEADRETLEFQAISRRGLVGSLEPGIKVCVEAVNSVGHSLQSDFSCTRYDPPHSFDQKLLVGVIGGGVALLLLLIVGAVILWKCRVYRKAKRDSSDGLGNPSYSTEGAL